MKGRFPYGMGRHILLMCRCGDVLFDAFKFIDVDGSGSLSKSELADGFAAVGVLVDDSVVDKVMEVRLQLMSLEHTSHKPS